MGSEAAPEYLCGSNMYCPPPANFYSYNLTGHDSAGKWHGQNPLFVPYGQDVHYQQALQNETSQVVYFPSDFGFAQNSYNQYSPSSVVGVNGSFIGSQEYFANPPCSHPISASPYFPIGLQPTGEILQPVDPVLFDGSFISVKPGTDAAKVPNALGYPYTPLASQRSVLPNVPMCVPQQFSCPTKQQKIPAVNQIPAVMQSLSNAMSHAPNLSYSAQHANLVLCPTQVPLAEAQLLPPVTSGVVCPGSDLRKLVSAAEFQPSSKATDPFMSGAQRTQVLAGQNAVTRPNWTCGQKTSTPVSVKSYSSKHSVVVPGSNISANQFNRDDFPVDYSHAKFFVIKSYSEDDVHKSIKYGVWSSTSNGNRKLNHAYEDSRALIARTSVPCPVFLFFSVNSSGQFCGVAEMVGPVDFHKNMDFWHQDKWFGCFPVKWHIVKDVPNSSFRQILLENNDFYPVTFSRDTQEVTLGPGMLMLKIFKSSQSKASILDDFMRYEELERNSRRPSMQLSFDAPAFFPVSHRVSLEIDGDPEKDDSVTTAGSLPEATTEADRLQAVEAKLELLSVSERQGEERGEGMGEGVEEADGTPMVSIGSMLIKVEKPTVMS